MDTTTATAIAIIGALSTALAGIGGWFSKQGVDAWLKLRADKREDARLEDAREDVVAAKEENTLRYIIGIQEGDLRSLRAEIKEMQVLHRQELRELHIAHNDCEKRQAQLEAELKVRMEFMNTRVTQVEAATYIEPKLHDVKQDIKQVVHEESRKVVHDLRNDINTVSLKSQAEKLKENPPQP